GAVGSNMGAPLVGQERLTDPRTIAQAVRMMEDVIGRRFRAVMSLEIGGGNSLQPFMAAALLGLPVVDADCMGRAFPEAQMTSFAIHDLQMYPLTLVDVRDNAVVVARAASWKWMERLSRTACVAVGSIASTCKAPRTGKEVKECAIPYSTSKALRIGHAVRDARHAASGADRPSRRGRAAHGEGGGSRRPARRRLRPRLRLCVRLMRRIGIDAGGTNTDAVLLEDDRVVNAPKTPTTPDVTTGIVSALGLLTAAMPARAGGIDAVMIGTTHFTNAVVQRRDLSPVAALRIGLPASASLPPFEDWPEDLARLVRGEVFMVEGGHEYDGRPIVPLDTAAVRQAGRRIRERGLTAAAIASVFSPLNPSCEEEAARILREECPGLSVTCSHDLGRIGLLERENATLL